MTQCEVEVGTEGYVVVPQGLDRANSDVAYHRRDVQLFRERLVSQTAVADQYDVLEGAVAVFDSPKAAVQLFVADATGKFGRSPLSVEEITSSTVQRVAVKSAHFLSEVDLQAGSPQAPKSWESAKAEGSVGFNILRIAESNAIFRNTERLYEEDIGDQYEVAAGDQTRADFTEALRSFLTAHQVAAPNSNELAIEEL